MNEGSGARDRSELCIGSEWVSSASKRASGRVKGPVPYVSISYHFKPACFLLRPHRSRSSTLSLTHYLRSNIYCKFISSYNSCPFSAEATLSRAVTTTAAAAMIVMIPNKTISTIGTTHMYNAEGASLAHWHKFWGHYKNVFRQSSWANCSTTVQLSLILFCFDRLLAWMLACSLAGAEFSCMLAHFL